MKRIFRGLVPDMTTPTPMTSETDWFVATLKPNGYAQAKCNLERQGFTTFMPLEVRRVRHARQEREVLRPLFPGYIFIAFNRNTTQWRVINNTIGVLGLIMLGANAPQKVPNELMSALLSGCDETGKILPPAEFTKGEKVRVLHGSFTGVLAEVEKTSQNDRVRLLVELMGRQVVTECASSSLRSLSA